MTNLLVRSFCAVGMLAGLVACGGSEGGGSAPASIPPVPTGSVTLQWDPVAAGDLAGYKVYQSTSAGLQGTLVKGDIPTSTTTFTVGNLQIGTTYYFVVKSFDTSGNESSASNQVSKTVQ